MFVWNPDFGVTHLAETEAVFGLVRPKGLPRLGCPARHDQISLRQTSHYPFNEYPS